MKRALAGMLICSMFLCGCSDMLDAQYHHIVPHKSENAQTGEEVVAVSNYDSLYNCLAELVENGVETGLISITRYDQDAIDADLETAVGELMDKNPICAYAVETITYERGTHSGQSAVAVNISYRHGRTEILQIQTRTDREDMENAICQALDYFEYSLVMYVQQYEELDFAQLVEHYAEANPDKVMEIPGVTAVVYPDSGESRVVELKFSYQNDRDAMRQMQSKVATLFSAASIYAGDDGEAEERYFKLYSFLMGLFQEFQIDTSITPAYSLLEHGVGDAEAFALVYAAMCRDAELECQVVTGTKNGEPWYWNIVCVEGEYYHTDLLECDDQDAFMLKKDAEMTGYVWDYSAYPAA